MTAIASINPTTGKTIANVAEPTTEAEVARIVERAAAAAPAYAALGRNFRSTFLRTIADKLEAAREDIVSLAHRETAIPEVRLNGELTRTSYQARFFADIIEDGGYLEVTIDRAGDTPMGPGPDLRRMLVPLGPVAVFGASNFPLAFSVPGGDTISALAAGNPVVVKAHGSHPALSLLCYDILASAATQSGAPIGTIGIVFGTRAGADLVAHPDIHAVGFTGSLSGGKALMDIIGGRENPIPFYGELSSLNPLIVTNQAAGARAASIAEGLVASITVSAGQLCTKPGLILAPQGEHGDALVDNIRHLIEDVPAAALLNDRIHSSYNKLHANLSTLPKVTTLAHGLDSPEHGFYATPRILEVKAEDVTGAELEECFGPSAVIVRYIPEAINETLTLLPSSLTATIHAEEDEKALVEELSTQLLPRTGRLIFNQYPTGLLVSWAQHHGGPWPATNAQHTSVGATAIRRFLRPLVWQNAPAHALPTELQDHTENIPRRVDGQLRLPTTVPS
ncbi:aldehyde dehydrogenase (NADP(+)) [Paenarthrobacter ilicis]|uniref:aldehyde dehydrogenase (NADP(+)) n=1 Tax=Paenarthrobacter ilicis TaxID=43665 RepID=UPI0028D6E56F|nr:aldehyde dehydrogenase (NADP(+)) [Paenarthrobacter ilicis]